MPANKTRQQEIAGSFLSARQLSLSPGQLSLAALRRAKTGLVPLCGHHSLRPERTHASDISSHFNNEFRFLLRRWVRSPHSENTNERKRNEQACERAKKIADRDRRPWRYMHCRATVSSSLNGQLQASFSKSRAVITVSQFKVSLGSNLRPRITTCPTRHKQRIAGSPAINLLFCVLRKACENIYFHVSPYRWWPLSRDLRRMLFVVVPFAVLREERKLTKAVKTSLSFYGENGGDAKAKALWTTLKVSHAFVYGQNHFRPLVFSHRNICNHATYLAGRVLSTRARWY